MPSNAVRGAVIALVATLFATPAFAAKSAKAGKSVKKREGGGQVAFFDLFRPENAGMMNLVPAYISLEPGSGVVSSRVTHLHPYRKKETRGIVLVGGDTAALSLRPGTYSVQVMTPVSDQPPGSYPTQKPRVWQSPVVKLVLSEGETICVVVEPGIQGTEYDGTWTISKAESPADCGAMTHRVTPDEDAPPPAAQ